MKSLLYGAAALAMLAAPAGAETRYDRKLEQAVMAIVAKRMDAAALRGSFGHDQAPVLVPATEPTTTDPTTTGSIGVETARLAVRPAIDGLMPAVERQVARVILF